MFEQSVVTSAYAASRWQSLGSPFLFQVSRDPFVGLFEWTLTHPARAFCEIKPIFKSAEELLEFAKKENATSTTTVSEINRMAFAKIEAEWRAWVKVHEEEPFDERKLDNMLMAALYRIILERDERKCIFCSTGVGLTIHHIIQKKRTVTNIVPPFGRSVPTNLVTLCRNCHSIYDPAILA